MSFYTYKTIDRKRLLETSVYEPSIILQFPHTRDNTTLTQRTDSFLRHTVLILLIDESTPEGCIGCIMIGLLFGCQLPSPDLYNSL